MRKRGTIKLTHDYTEWLEWIKPFRKLSIDTETRGLHIRDKITTIQVGTEDDQVFILDCREKYYVLDGRTRKQVRRPEYYQVPRLSWDSYLPSPVGQAIVDGLSDKILLWHNGVFDLNHLVTMFGVPVYTDETLYTEIDGKRRLRIYDSMSVENILNNGKLNYSASLASVVEKYCGVDLPKETVKELITWHNEFLPHHLQYMANDVLYLFDVAKAQTEQLRKLDSLHIASKVELPLLPVISDMSTRGFFLDRIQWQGLIDSNFDAAYEAAEGCKYALASHIVVGDQMGMFGQSIDPTVRKMLNSPKQLREVFEKILGEDCPKSLGKNELTMIDDPLAEAILEYREHEKFLQSFGQKLLDLQDPFGMLHPVINPQVRSGRMSMRDPNLTNQPHAKEVRAAYTSPTWRWSPELKLLSPFNDYVMIICDYSQMELRLLADMSQDPVMLDIFNNGLDLHITTASKAYHIPMEQVTDDQRSKGKTTNFSVVYGIMAKGLARRLSVMMTESASRKNGYLTLVEVSEKEAQQLIDGMRRAYPVAFEWLDKTRADVLTNHFVRTPFGRIRWFEMPHHNDKDYEYKIGAIQRQAGNTPIQGANADASKLAMIRLWQKLQPYRAYLGNMIHDELVVYAPRVYANDVMNVVQTAMTEEAKRFMHYVKVKADPKIAEFWAK